MIAFMNSVFCLTNTAMLRTLDCVSEFCFRCFALIFISLLYLRKCYNKETFYEKGIIYFSFACSSFRIS